MPIRPELRPFYPPHWHELSSYVRFERAEGRCQRCRRPHLTLIRCLPDGRWFDEQTATWRDRQGRMARWPDLMEATRFRMTRVVLAAAHLDSDPRNNRLTNLRALCQRCHLLQDRSHHLAQRWITYRRRRAIGDLFLGPYQALVANCAETQLSTWSVRRHLDFNMPVATPEIVSTELRRTTRSPAWRASSKHSRSVSTTIWPRQASISVGGHRGHRSAAQGFLAAD